MVGSVAIALVTIWAAIACSYETNWPVGFFVGVFSAAWYGFARLDALWHRARGTANEVSMTTARM